MRFRTSVQSGPSATEPPERRGVPRDRVRLLVSDAGSMRHTRFDRIGDHLGVGDLIVVNNSPTRKAAIDAGVGELHAVLHVATRLETGKWLIEVRKPDQSGPLVDLGEGSPVDLGREGVLRLTRRFEPSGRLWLAEAETTVPLETILETRGRPIRYSYVPDEHSIDDYQTIFALPDGTGGSAEMPSAGRPFSWRVVTDLIRRGVTLAPVTLHTGLSSQETGEPPHPEWFDVPASTAALVALTRARGRRVIAVGTTVTRALETATSPDGAVHGASGWTQLVVGEDRPIRTVDGLVTGWHPPEASHLDMLRQVAGDLAVESAYEEAASHGYLWHEFGDACLFLRG